MERSCLSIPSIFHRRHSHPRTAHCSWLVVAVLFLWIPMAEGATIMVTNTSNSGPGSLYQAILDANTTAGLDEIQFAIPGMGPHTIFPTAALPLPTITDRVRIEGYTQPGASPNTNPMDATPTLGTNAVVMIEIDGDLTAANAVGLHIQADRCAIVGLAINNFHYTGSVAILLDGVTGTRIGGNFIGVDVSGTTSVGSKAGVKMLDAPDNTVGGAAPHTRNLLAAGGQTGGSYAVWITGSGSIGNSVRGNQFGTDMSGNAAMPGYWYGKAVYISNEATGNVIGGNLLEDRNIICHHDLGIFISEAHENQVLRNYIGVNINGELDPPALAIPNLQGIRVVNGRENIIGGDIGNIVAYNGRGVVVAGGVTVTSWANAINQNTIFRNDELGIDLEDDDVTLNDWFDPDPGANELQNFPVITSAKVPLGSSTSDVTGYIVSRPNVSYKIELFVNRECDTFAGYGEGESYQNARVVTTNLWGFATFSAPVTAIPYNDFITATATNADGNTSEFSLCEEVTGGISIEYGPVVVTPVGQDQFSVTIPLTNMSQVTAYGVMATVETTDPQPGWWMPIPDDSSFYGDIPAGGSVEGDGFTVNLSEWPGGSFLCVMDLVYVLERDETIHHRLPVWVDPGVIAVDEPLTPLSASGLHSYPNPANPGTTTHFELAATQDVRLRIYDARGVLVRILLEERVGPGPQSVLWDGRDDSGRPSPSGTYVVRLETGHGVQATKVMLVR